MHKIGSVPFKVHKNKVAVLFVTSQSASLKNLIAMYEALYQDQNEYQAVGLKNAFIKQVFFNFLL